MFTIETIKRNIVFAKTYKTWINHLERKILEKRDCNFYMGRRWWGGVYPPYWLDLRRLRVWFFSNPKCVYSTAKLREKKVRRFIEYKSTRFGDTDFEFRRVGIRIEKTIVFRINIVWGAGRVSEILGGTLRARCFLELFTDKNKRHFWTNFISYEYVMIGNFTFETRV